MRFYKQDLYLNLPSGSIWVFFAISWLGYNLSVGLFLCNDNMFFLDIIESMSDDQQIIYLASLTPLCYHHQAIMDSRFDWYSLSLQQGLLHAGLIVGFAALMEIVYALFAAKLQSGQQAQYHISDFILHRGLLFIGYLAVAMNSN